MSENPTSRRQIISCATVAEELSRLGVSEEEMTVLEFGLHLEPDSLREALQETIDSLGEGFEVLLGYGLCSYAVIGLKSHGNRLVIPKVQDCISLFLGSESRRMSLLADEPGTYFFTKGWIEAADDAASELERLREKYGDERARRVAKVLLANYTRIALINTGNYRMDEYREFAREQADWLGLRFEEVPGSNRLLLGMLSGEYEGAREEYLVVPPGSTVTREAFGVP